MDLQDVVKHLLPRLLPMRRELISFILRCGLNIPSFIINFGLQKVFLFLIKRFFCVDI